MARKYRLWIVRWAVESKGPHGVFETIYMSRTKREAQADARKWTAETGFVTRIIRGPDHPKVRSKKP